MTDVAPRSAGASRARATVHTMAADLGVSASSVSRAFSRPELVNAELRQRILDHARRVGYRPSSAARGLVTGRTNLVGVVVHDIENPFCPPLVRALQGAARGTGRGLVLADAAGRPSDAEEQVAGLARNVDALVLIGSQLPDAALGRLAGEVPLVLVNRVVAGHAGVSVDPRPALYAAADRLLADGHRRFAVLEGPRASWAARRRAATVGTRARRHQVDLLRLPLEDPDLHRAGFRAAQGLLDHRRTAVFAFDDLQACGVLAGLHERGATVPRDLSLVGFDDVLLSRSVSPRLTTVSTPFDEIGRLALELLAHPSAPPRQLRVAGSLVVRDSTGPAPRGGAS